MTGSRAGLDGCGKSRPNRDSIPGSSTTYHVAIPTELSRPTGVEVQLNVLLTSPLDEGKWSTSCPGSVTPGGRYRYAMKRNWACPRGSLDDLEYEKCIYLESAYRVKHHALHKGQKTYRLDLHTFPRCYKDVTSKLLAHPQQVTVSTSHCFTLTHAICVSCNSSSLVNTFLTFYAHCRIQNSLPPIPVP